MLSLVIFLHVSSDLDALYKLVGSRRRSSLYGYMIPSPGIKEVTGQCIPSPYPKSYLPI